MKKNKNIISLLLVFLMVSFSFIAIQDLVSSRINPCKFKGRVTDNYLNFYLGGVKVTCRKGGMIYDVDYTDANGYYEVWTDPLFSNTYVNLIFEYSGYNTKTVGKTAKPGETITYSPKLIPPLDADGCYETRKFKTEFANFDTTHWPDYYPPFWHSDSDFLSIYELTEIYQPSTDTFKVKYYAYVEWWEYLDGWPNNAWLIRVERLVDTLGGIWSNWLTEDYLWEEEYYYEETYYHDYICFYGERSETYDIVDPREWGGLRHGLVSPYLDGYHYRYTYITGITLRVHLGTPYQYPAPYVPLPDQTDPDQYFFYANAYTKITLLAYTSPTNTLKPWFWGGSISHTNPLYGPRIYTP